jgi:hypothetical protein
MNNHELHTERMNLLYSAWSFENDSPAILEKIREGTLHISPYTPRLQVIRKILADLKNARYRASNIMMRAQVVPVGGKIMARIQPSCGGQV